MCNVIGFSSYDRFERVILGGVSYEDVIVRGASPERIINIYNNQGSNVSPKPVCRYRVTGDAHDFGCWEYIE